MIDRIWRVYTPKAESGNRIKICVSKEQASKVASEICEGSALISYVMESIEGYSPDHPVKSAWDGN